MPPILGVRAYYVKCIIQAKASGFRAAFGPLDGQDSPVEDGPGPLLEIWGLGRVVGIGVSRGWRTSLLRDAGEPHA